MKRALIITLLAMGLVAAYALPAAAAGMKIAYVDLQRALLEVDEGKKAKADLKVYFDDKQEYLDKESERLKKMKEDLEKQEMMIEPEVKAKREAELQQKFVEVQKIYYQLQNELKQKESEAVQPILEKMQSIIQNIAERDNYDLILDKNSSGIVYAPMKHDLTNELIRLYDQKYGKGKSKK